MNERLLVIQYEHVQLRCAMTEAIDRLTCSDCKLPRQMALKEQPYCALNRIASDSPMVEISTCPVKGGAQRRFFGRKRGCKSVTN